MTMSAQPPKPPGRAAGPSSTGHDDLVADRARVRAWLDKIPLANPEQKAEDAQLLERARALLHSKRAVMVAHYYTDPALQALAEESGGCVADSLEMARFGSLSDAPILMVAGVRFMGETAKILNPEKTVLMPTLEATCSLDIGCPADEFAAFCGQYPEHLKVVYANTSVAVKAMSDWV